MLRCEFRRIKHINQKREVFWTPELKGKCSPETILRSKKKHSCEEGCLGAPVLFICLGHDEPQGKSRGGQGIDVFKKPFRKELKVVVGSSGKRRRWA